MSDPTDPPVGSIDWIVKQQVETQLSEEEASELFEMGLDAYNAAKQTPITRTSLLMTPLAYWLV